MSLEVAYFLLCGLSIFQSMISGSKLYTGQRMFTDTDIISFVDPSKHGFHVILDAKFVETHLRPVHLPTIYASAIALSPKIRLERHRIGNETFLDDGGSSSRVTKVLYPENGNPDDGLLDGRTVKLLGLRERSWYFVCVEFESNVNRHEIATGTACRLARTLDKFGKTVESTVSEIELLEITDESIRVHVKVDADFPLKLSVYLSPSVDSISRDSPVPNTPAQMFIVRHSRLIDVVFASLKPSTMYGRLCILEEPLTQVYTAMGRSARVVNEYCYFEDLRTKERDMDYVRKMYEKGLLFLPDQNQISNALTDQETAKLVSSASVESALFWLLVLCLPLSLFSCTRLL